MAAHHHHAVFADAPVQQQTAGADLRQRELGFQLLSGMLGTSQSSGAERQSFAPQQPLQRLGALLPDRQHDIGVAMPATRFDTPKPAAVDPHRWIARSKLQHK